MEKFLKTAWKIDPDRGEANFDIDGENLQSDQYDLFTGNIERPHKIQLYEKELREKILKKELSNNKQIYIYTITHGFLPSHARDVIKNLKSKKLINNSKFGISYDVYKNPELVIEIDIT